MTQLLGNFIGGLGLLLLGMSLMSDGLKLASGNALREILGSWTRTRLRGLFAGAFITGLVQSSGAVTVATIGFANAGLLTLERAIWVIYGSNIGSTMTGWIVALIGFQFDIREVALPLIGLGALLKFTGRHGRRAHIGTALVGFGLLFLGIGFLKSTFDASGALLAIPHLDYDSFAFIVLYAQIGMVLAALMQSSSAVLVIALSAAQGGTVPLATAAAIIVGASIGTTTTGLLSSLGATPNAKRVAFSHLAFNVMTSVAALLLMVPLLAIADKARALLGIPPTPASTLALFQTLFTVLGVLLIWPFTGLLQGQLQKRFRTLEEEEAQPRHLDQAVLALPYVAVDTIAREVVRINHHTIEAFRKSLRFDAQGPPSFAEHRIVRGLADAVGKYAVELGRNEMTPLLSEKLAGLMESTQQYLLVIDMTEDLALDSGTLRRNLHEDVRRALDEYIASIQRHLDAQDAGNRDKPRRGTESYEAVEKYYRTLKEAILRSATRGDLTMENVDLMLQYLNEAKHGCRELLKATQRLLLVHDWLRHTPQA
jgi:phosphate:Na+ symporter